MEDGEADLAFDFGDLDLWDGDTVRTGEALRRRLDRFCCTAGLVDDAW